MVVCLTWDKGAIGLSLSGGTMLFPCARHVILYLVLVQPRKRPDMTENFLTDMGGSRGEGPPPPAPWKITKNRFFSNTGPDPLKKIAKLLGQNSMLGHHPDASETPFNNGPLLVVFWSSTLSSTKRRKKHCQSWTPSDKSFWIRAWLGCKVSTKIIEVHSCSVLVC